MSPLFSLIFFFILAAGSLVTVSIINKKEKERRFIRQKLANMKQQVEELEELVIEVDQLVLSRAIVQVINDEIVEMLEAMLQLDESATYLQASLNSARSRGESLYDETSDRHVDRLKESDAQIAKAQKNLENAARIIRQQQGRGRISLEEMNGHIEELSWTHLMIEAVSYTGQGHKAVNRNDVLTSHAFYKKAQQNLMQSANPDRRRHQLIRELSEILANQRQFLSLDIMWEDHYNPKERSAPTVKAPVKEAPQVQETSQAKESSQENVEDSKQEPSAK